MRARILARAIILGVWLLFPTRSWADEPARANAPVLLDWRASEGCPRRDEIVNEVNRLLVDATRTSSPSLVARANIVRDAKNYVLDLELDQERRTTRRRLVARTCAELGRAAALVVALAIDPSLTAPKEAAQAPVALECPPLTEPVCPNTQATVLAPRPCLTTPVPKVPALEAPTPRTLPRAEDRRDFHAGAAVRLATGELPEKLPSAELLVGYGTTPFRFDLGARFAAAHSTVATGAAAFQSWTLRPRACVATPLRHLVGSVCAGASLGRVRGEGAGADVVHTRWSTWVAPGLELLLEWPIGSSAVGLSLAGEVPLVRTNFQLAGTSVFEPAKFVASAALVGTIGLF